WANPVQGESSVKGPSALCSLGRWVIAVLLPRGMFASVASAAPVHQFNWSDWWLPKVYSEHGHSMDALFNWIFGITSVALVVVQATLVVFLIKYRHNAARRKAH